MNRAILLSDLVQAVKSGKFAFRNCDHKQASPTQFAILFDAGLECNMAVAKIYTLKHAFSSEGLIGIEASEGAIRAIGL